MTNDQAERIAMALESIARSLVTLAHPPTLLTPVDASNTFSESWHYVSDYPVGLAEALRSEPEA